MKMVDGGAHYMLVGNICANECYYLKMPSPSPADSGHEKSTSIEIETSLRETTRRASKGL